MQGNGHTNYGRFQKGNPGGPGRPRRAVEREYLAALSDAVNPDQWRRVVEKALQDAQAGDATARAWLSKYLLGDTPATLMELAAKEARGENPADEITTAAKQQTTEKQRQEELISLLEGLANRI